MENEVIGLGWDVLETLGGEANTAAYEMRLVLEGARILSGGMTTVGPPGR